MIGGRHWGGYGRGLRGVTLIPKSESLDQLVCSTVKDVSQCVANFWANERQHQVTAYHFEGPILRNDALSSDTAQKIGCYAIFAEDESLLYVGMSQTSLSSRLTCHFSKKVQQSEFWSRLPYANYVGFAQVSNKWEAVALEAYLNEHTKNLWSHRMDEIRLTNPAFRMSQLVCVYNSTYGRRNNS
jgi:predicted GIY-YIG superfamily endonuclease